MLINADELARVFFQKWEIDFAMKQTEPVKFLEGFANDMRGWDTGEFVIMSHPSEGVSVKTSWAGETILNMSFTEIAKRAHRQLLQPVLGI